MEQMEDADYVIVAFGSGEHGYEAFFNDLAYRHPGRVGVYIGFNATLAQQIYAGSDIFLMPSKSEPCGLSQMVAFIKLAQPSYSRMWASRFPMPQVSSRISRPYLP